MSQLLLQRGQEWPIVKKRRGKTICVSINHRHAHLKLKTKKRAIIFFFKETFYSVHQQYKFNNTRDKAMFASNFNFNMKIILISLQILIFMLQSFTRPRRRLV